MSQEDNGIDRPMLLLCGRFTGDEQRDREKFQHYSEMLSQNGFLSMSIIEYYKLRSESIGNRKPIKPVNCFNNNDRPLQISYFLEMLEDISEWDGIYLLPDWESSYFSAIIMLWAKLVDLDIYYHDEQGNIIQIVNPQSFYSTDECAGDGVESDDDSDDRMGDDDFKPESDGLWKLRTEENPVERKLIDILNSPDRQKYREPEDPKMAELGLVVEKMMRYSSSWRRGLG